MYPCVLGVCAGAGAALGGLCEELCVFATGDTYKTLQLEHIRISILSVHLGTLTLTLTLHGVPFVAALHAGGQCAFLLLFFAFFVVCAKKLCTAELSRAFSFKSC